MNVMLLVAGLLSALIGIAHSVLGERLLLGPLFERGDLPKLLGSAAFARRTLRFTWHLTTVLLLGIGVMVMILSLAPLDSQSACILRVLAITFAVCSLLSLIGARARHFSWWVFLIISVLLWFGA
jgi:VIT1/CCC1 family predicted Fe2+/Mn2+ transporter